MPRDRAQQALPDRNDVLITMRDNSFLIFRKALIGPKSGQNPDNVGTNFGIAGKIAGQFLQYRMMIDLDTISIVDR
jgi:hypothetical protein